ncbi:MAG TPA: alpha/beta hydrolase [Pyrinomonadaceae bacterium]|nr:alpha/beta hydrolase [Pyrinomonadaceae bacterium]
MFLGLLLFIASFVPVATIDRGAEVVSAADGVPIHYSVQGKGEPALVFIHCWSCDRHLWDDQVSAFAKNHKVVTIDLPGHGESGQRRKNWSIESYGDDVKRVVEKLNLKRVVLIGSSMGGPIALEATRQMPERVTAIVPVDTLHNVENKLPPEQLEEVYKQLRADYKGAITGFLNQLFFSPSTPPAVKSRIISEVTSRPPELAIAILQGIFAHDSAPALREIKVPIRAINADMNPIAVEVNRKYAPQFDVVIIKGTGHYPMLEDPKRFNELLAEVLRNLRLASK